jgi:hypothetical protein
VTATEKRELGALDLRHTFATFALRAGISTLNLTTLHGRQPDHDRPRGTATSRATKPRWTCVDADRWTLQPPLELVIEKALSDPERVRNRPRRRRRSVRCHGRMKGVSERPLIRVAAQNNAEWCDVMRATASWQEPLPTEAAQGRVQEHR